MLKILHDSKASMPDFSGRKRYDGTHDIVFKSYSDACKAKDVLDTKLENIQVGSPILDNMKKFNLVGLEFNMSVTEVTDAQLLK